MAAELLPLRALDLKDAKKFGIFCKNQKIPNVLVDLKRLELSTSRMRTERSRKVVSFLPMDCGVWFDENDRRGAIKNTAFSVPIRN